MKTAVYQINSKYVHSSLAAWYLSAAIRERGCESFVLEGTVNENEDALFERAASSSARIFAFCCYIWNIDIVLSIAKRLKESDPAIKIILGGTEVGYRAENVLSGAPYVDYVISGEGEIPLSELVSSLVSGSEIPDIDGISFVGRISSPYVMSSDPPDPYSDEYFSTLGGRIVYLETSRGCPYRCAYCLSCVQGLRFFDIDRAKKNLLALAASGTSTVKLIDRTFNADRARARELFRFIIDARAASEIPDGVTFHFELAADLIDEQTLSVIKEAPAGLFQFEIGVQSFNADTLRAVSRKCDLERIAKVIREISSWGNIHVHTDLIAGLPYESIESFADSYNRLYSLGSHKIQLGILKLLWGSDMRKNRERYPCEFDEHPPYAVSSTPWLSSEDLDVIRMAERANDGIFFSSRFVLSTEYIMNASGIDPFSLAVLLGKRIYEEQSPPLDRVFSELYEFASDLEGVDPDRLRDLMLCDRIAKDNSCVIPRVLRREDARLGRYSSLCDRMYPRKAGVRRSVGIMYTEGCVIFADYDSSRSVSGLYEVRKVDERELLLFEEREND